jgi:Double zinc ribbon
MFCTQCGKKNPEAARFCFACGRQLAVTTASPALASVASDVLLQHPPLPVPIVPETTEYRPGQQCPSCGLFNPGVAERCDCGYDFDARVLRRSPDLSEGSRAGTSEAILPFFPVATHKFIVLSICTFDIYQLYWFYQNWKRMRNATGENISPFWRAFWAPLWGFSFFQRVRERSTTEGVRVEWNPWPLAAFYFVLTVSWRLPDPWWLISLFSFVPMIPVQQVTQRINARCTTQETSNDVYSGANIATIVCGGLFLVLAVVGTFLPE